MSKIIGGYGEEVVDDLSSSDNTAAQCMARLVAHHGQELESWINSEIKAGTDINDIVIALIQTMGSLVASVYVEFIDPTEDKKALRSSLATLRLNLESGMKAQRMRTAN